MSTETRQGIRQKDYMTRNGIPPLEIKAFRDKHLTPDEWWKEGVSIMWDADAVRRIDYEKATGLKAPTVEDFEKAISVFRPSKPSDLLPTGEDPAADVAAAYRAGLVPPNPLVKETEFVQVLITKPARNKFFMYGSIGDGNKIAVRCGKYGKKLIGKTVRCRAEGPEGGKAYTYEP